MYKTAIVFMGHLYVIYQKLQMLFLSWKIYVRFIVHQIKITGNLQ